MSNKKSKSIKPKVLYLKDRTAGGLFSSLGGGAPDTYEIFHKKLMAVPYDRPVDIIITTHGGSALWCSKICYVLKHRSGQSRVFVKSYAHSAGAVIALTASELYITADTTFSAIDAQAFPFGDLFQTSLQGLSKLIQDPRKAFVELSNDRAQYFRQNVVKFLNNDLHNKDTIMKEMHDDSPIHEQLFFKEDMKRIGIKYKIWDGKNLNGISEGLHEKNIDSVSQPLIENNVVTI